MYILRTPAKLLQSCLTLGDHIDCSPPGSSVQEISPGKNIGVGCHFLLQGNLPDPVIKPPSLSSPVLADSSSQLASSGKPKLICTTEHIVFNKGDFREGRRKRVRCMERVTWKLTLPYVKWISSVQSLSRVRLFATPWSAARQASLSITNSRSPPKPMSIVLVIPSNHLILCRPLLLVPPIFPSIRVSQWEFAVWFRELKQGPCDNLEGWGREGGLGGVDMGVPMDDYTLCIYLLMSDRKPQNSVKQLSFN